ncbi:interleukin-27 subunit beta [Gouania willdenowi]|uniref:Fibronectin type-III domain-containing protein n=1 Tax=Gouania willdenowi TaxID=441366 RepID=A0A8C5I0Y5_GOUWI|nr:interleukin-27 subunit beta [Gouania willdenowi]
MAALLLTVFVALTFLTCVPGGEGLDLLRTSTTSGNASSAPAVLCRCSTYPNVTLCWWPEPPHSPPLHYVISYSERHKPGSVNMCTPSPPSSSSSSSSSSLSSSSAQQLWRCHLPSLKLYTDYIVNVTAVYPAGTSSHLTSFMLEDIVKPDPPEGVTVSHHHGRKFLVQWNPPPTWNNLDLFPLKYHVQYQWESRDGPRSVNLGPFENTSVELKALGLGRLYLFQVCAEDLLGLGQCSDWSSPAQLHTPHTTTQL